MRAQRLRGTRTDLVLPTPRTSTPPTRSLKADKGHSERSEQKTQPSGPPTSTPHSPREPSRSGTARLLTGPTAQHGHSARDSAPPGTSRGAGPYLVVRARVPDNVPQQHLPHRHPRHPPALGTQRGRTAPPPPGPLPAPGRKCRCRAPPRGRPGPEEGGHFRSLSLRDGGVMADAVLGRAARLWALLDEMAENQPRAYRRLLREQRAQAERFCARPEPRLCVRTLPAAGKPHPGLGPARGAACAPLFVNVCGWRRVPGPAELRASIPVIAGPLQEAAGGGGACPAPGGGPGRGGGRGPSVPKKPQTGTRPSPAEDAYPVAAGAEHGPLHGPHPHRGAALCPEATNPIPLLSSQVL